MSDQLKKTLIGALVAVALAAAVSYGLISQQTADQIQNQTNQTLNGNQSPPQQQTNPQLPNPQNPGGQNPGAQNPGGQTPPPAQGDSSGSQNPPQNPPSTPRP